MALQILANNVKTLRKAAGWRSAEKFAEYLDIPYPTLRDIEAGLSEGRTELRQAIADALEVPLSRLYEVANPNNESEWKPPKGEGFKGFADHEELSEVLFEASSFLSQFALAPADLKNIVLFLMFDADRAYLESVSRPVLQKTANTILAVLKAK